MLRPVPMQIFFRGFISPIATYFTFELSFVFIHFIQPTSLSREMGGDRQCNQAIWQRFCNLIQTTLPATTHLPCSCLVYSTELLGKRGLFNSFHYPSPNLR